ncbi:aminopeptidase [Nitrosomonas sp. JL21]|uniref:aminopeptidase n=1 Tax=Nitrosomonas sp. JL21 TaxID=153949 RepID=UPI0013DE517C|nr:aminopeptidase [Nitrosomonas sp. JL21]
MPDIVKLFLLISQLWVLAACTNLPYYAQAIGGHFDVVHRSQPIQRLIANPDVDPQLKQSLTKVMQLREFASRELKLPDNLSYTSYADLERPYVVWNVFASPELSLKLKEWCFVQVGCVNYRGFFSQAQAEQYAEELRNEGYDVHVGGIRAYSTLGWFSDPVLNTFIGYSEMNLARLIFHELAHQVVYVPDDSVFNESFATAVEHEGVRRWFEQGGTPSQQVLLTSRQEREALFIELVFKHRERLRAVFHSNVSDAEKRAQKARIFEEMRAEFLHLRTQRADFGAYDQWFAQPLNNARLATVSIYTQWVPAFQAILEHNGHDMVRFFENVIQLSKLSKDDRQVALQKAAAGHQQWMMVKRGSN